jgi:CubicO group peptidase (beta-lactamase class C family)
MGGYCLSQPTTGELAARIDAYLAGEAAGGQFSGSVLVADEGEIVISKGYGMASIELSVPNTPATKFRIASLTKQFTAMAIMILQERGLLNVQNRISLHVPNCPGAWASITIHHLLTHTSGIPDFMFLPGNYPDYWRVPHTVDETMALFRDLPLRFPPGARYEYSNSGYIVLGQIIEVLSHTTYEDFITRNILEPLGMTSSGYDHSGTIIQGLAAGYVRENGVLLNAVHIEMDAAYAAGALYSTVEDLFLWDQSLYTTRLVSQPSLDALFTPHTATGQGYDYGYGWNVERQFNRTTCGHGGLISGFGGYIGRFPEERVFIVVLSNFEASVWELWLALAGIVQEAFDPMLLAHWSLDETAGVIAHDSTGNNDATVMGAPLWQPDGGKVGGALQLSGIPNFVTTKFVCDPSQGPLSVFAWVKGGAPGQVILSQVGGANWLLAVAGTGGLATELKESSRKSTSLISTAVIVDGDWHRVGLSWDGSNRILYVDDTEVAKDTQASLAGSAGNLTIGAGSTMTPTSFWSGLIDDVRIYDRAVKP